MTVVPFPTAQARPSDAPELRLPIGAVTIDGTAHHMHPAAAELTLCMVPIDVETVEYSPFDPDATELAPIDCEACEQAKWFAQSLLKAHALQPADPVGLRWSAGASLAAAHSIDPTEVPE